MSRSSQTQTPQHQQSAMTNQHRNSGSFIGTEIPAANNTGFYTNGRDRAGAPQNFDLARSPPNASAKNTKHVPCKFFRQGACQAGAACPFSHSLDPMMHQAPCKYFMKGNCKFGAKCALAHYLPNGHRVSRADLDAGMRGGFVGGRSGDMPPFTAQDQPFSDPYLQPAFNNPDYFPGQDLPFLDDEQDAYNDRYNQYQSTLNNNYQSNTNYDSGVGSPPTSQFGSPPADGLLQKQGIEHSRSALTAPLPASFDANSLPHIAKFGPFGQSVPDKFGMRSPPNSVITRNIKLGGLAENTNTTRLSSIGTTLRNVSSPLGMSPQHTDDLLGQKSMHSQKQTKPRMISASVPRTGLQWGGEDMGPEADLLPSSLHDDVMLPQDKIRRLSRPDQPFSTRPREGSNGLNIPMKSPNTVGSPPTGSSPSRFRAFFDEQRKKDEGLVSPNLFGHVGSPLRETWIPQETPEVTRGKQISAITQQVARMELSRTESSETNGSATRPLAGLRSGSSFGRFDRAISSPGLPGRKIDEDPDEGIFFRMDDESSKRNSGWSQGSVTLREKENMNSAKLDTTSRGFNINNGMRPIFGFGQQ